MNEHHIETHALLLSESFSCCRCGSREDLIVYDLRDCNDSLDFVAICRPCDAKES